MTTFVQSTLPSSAAWISVAYGNGRFVAIANSSVSACGNAVFVTDPTPRCDVKTAPERLTVITTTCESLRLWKADSDSLSVRTDDAELILEVTL